MRRAALALILVACSSNSTDPPADTAEPTGEEGGGAEGGGVEGGGEGGGEDSGGDEGSADDTGEPVTSDLCADLGLSVQEFQDVEDDDTLYAVAADITLETTTGPWTLSEAWTGCEVYLFIPSDPRQAVGYANGIWERNGDTRQLFDDLPLNTQLFFLASAGTESGREEAFESLQSGLDSAYERMDAETRAWWEARVHLVEGRARTQPGWLGDTLTSPNWGTAIDRFQKIRYIGSFADPQRYDSSIGWFAPNLSMAAWEAVYYNFEAERADALDADGATVVSVFDGDLCSGSVEATATLPTADELAAFDTLTVDLTMGCDGEGEYGTCPAWDYMAYLYACDYDADDNPYAATACTSGDTLPGTCSSPQGTTSDATYTCNDEGTGYDNLSCSCNTEVGRWITTYHRIGRWSYDISAYLPLLARGGEQRFQFQTSGPYVLDMDLRLSNQGKEARPEEITYVFAGGGIYPGSNDLYEPVTVTIPADATKVELATVISGHGADSNNCGEFCDMHHHFTVNGDEDREIVVEFPESTTLWGCQQQVEEGTIPNQYGTWWYGRAGWCPGKEVPTDMWDITDQVTPGEDATFTYRALFEGAEYTGYSTNRMHAWLVISR